MNVGSREYNFGRNIYTVYRRLPGRRALVVVFIKNTLFEIIAFIVFECL